MGKWTQTGLALDWHVQAMVAHVFYFLFSFAMKGCKFKEISADEHISDCVEGFSLEVNSHAVTGKWCKVNEGHLHDVDACVHALITALLIEPQRLLTTFYMVASTEDFISGQKSWPPILNVLNCDESLLFHSIQYWSTILARPSTIKRLVLVWKFRKCRSFESWYAEYPQDLDLLRRGAYALIAAVERRQKQPLSAQFGVLQIADARVSEASKLSLGIKFVSRSRCCVPHGIPRGVHIAADGSVSKLLGLMPSLLYIAYLIRLSIACIEFLHKLHRNLVVNKATSFRAFSAKSVCARMKDKFVKFVGANVAAEPIRTPAKAEPARGLEFTNLKRAVGPYEVFRKRLKQEDVAECKAPHSCLTEAGRRHYADAWESASIEEPVECDRISAATKSLMRARRAAINVKVRQPNSALDEGAGFAILEHRNPEAILEAPVCLDSVFYNDEQRDVLEVHGRQPLETASTCLSEDFLASYYAGKGLFEGNGQKTQAASIADWTKRARAYPASDFPTRCQYRSHCGASCKNGTEEFVLQLRLSIQRAFSRMVTERSAKNQPKLVSGGDLVICVEVVGDADKGMHFVRVSDAVAKSGRHPTVQMLSSLIPLGHLDLDPPFVGLVLQQERLPHTIPSCSLPELFKETCAGCLVMYSDDVFASRFRSPVIIRVLRCEVCLSASLRLDQFHVREVLEECIVDVPIAGVLHAPSKDASPTAPVLQDVPGSPDSDFGGGMEVPDFASMCFGCDSGAPELGPHQPAVVVPGQLGQDAPSPDDDLGDWLERGLELLMSSTDLDLLRTERVMDALDEEMRAKELQDEAASSSAKSTGANLPQHGALLPSESSTSTSSSSGGSSWSGLDIANVCASLSLVDVSKGSVFRFAHSVSLIVRYSRFIKFRNKMAHPHSKRHAISNIAVAYVGSPSR